MSKITRSSLTKKIVASLLIALTLVAPLHSVFPGIPELIPTVSAAYTYTYYPACASSHTSIVNALKSIGVDSSFSNRKSIAAINGISGYSGTASQNIKMLNLLKQGRLIKSVVSIPDPVPSSSGSNCYPRYIGGSGSLVDALNAIGEDSSYANRKTIASVNGISGYSGKASENTYLLDLLKQGRLVRPGSSDNTNYTQSRQGNLVDSNLSRVKYIAQGSKTCKASSAAMAINLISGNNDKTTANMGGSSCNGIDSKKYTGSDGRTYRATYKTDSYVGSASEQKNAIETALNNGLPIVAAVHSTRSGRTQHHWIVIVGRSGSDYLVVDPASGSSGAMSANVKTMSSLSYDFGLTDYRQTHYGYICFTVE